MDPIIISFFTKSTLYESEVQNLIDSCNEFNLTYEIEGIESMGSWEYNCCYKPLYILKKLLILKKPILWIDADAVILQKPEIDDWDGFCDISLRIHSDLPISHPSKLCTGTIFVNYTDAALKLLQLWKEECKTRLLEKHEDRVWDQKCLRDVIYRKKCDARIHPLPIGYCQIYDKESDQLPEDQIYVRHFQASRLYQKIVDQEISLPGLMEVKTNIKNFRTGNLK